MLSGDKPLYPLCNVHFTSDMDKGVTIREHFASMAMAALIPTWIEGTRNHKDIIATQAIEIADALINELNKPTNQ